MVARYAGTGSPRLARRTALILATLAIGALAFAARADAYIYWANDASPSASVVGRANLDGTKAIPDFIPSASITQGVAVNSSHIYWTNVCNGAIGRATLTGRGINQSFITGLIPPNSACSPPSVAADDKHIYWANLSTGAIGRANLNGSGVNENFIPSPSPKSLQSRSTTPTSTGRT